MVRCEECKGEGTVPKSNGLIFSRLMRRVVCDKCKGEGYVRGPGLNTGSGPYPEGIPNE